MPESSAPEATSRSTAERVIRALISIAPACTSREARAIIAASPTTPLSALFIRVFQAAKLTSKELRHFLGVASRCKALGLRIEKDVLNEEGLAALASLRFPPIDRHSSQAVLCYFSLVDQLFDSFTPDQLLSLFQRLLFVMRQKISTDYQLYVYLRRFLSSYFLEFFLFRRLYSPLTFPFTTDFALDFRSVLGLRLAKLGYEHPPLRELVFSLLLLNSHSTIKAEGDYDVNNSNNYRHNQHTQSDIEMEKASGSDIDLYYSANNAREELYGRIQNLSVAKKNSENDHEKPDKMISGSKGHKSLSDSVIKGSENESERACNAESTLHQIFRLQNYAFSPLDWLLQSWSLLSTSFYSISEMFYRYDCSLFMEPAALRRFSVVGDVLETIRADLRGINPAECSLCSFDSHITSSETSEMSTSSPSDASLIPGETKDYLSSEDDSKHHSDNPNQSFYPQNTRKTSERDHMRHSNQDEENRVEYVENEGKEQATSSIRSTASSNGSHGSILAEIYSTKSGDINDQHKKDADDDSVNQCHKEQTVSGTQEKTTAFSEHAENHRSSGNVVSLREECGDENSRITFSAPSISRKSNGESAMSRRVEKSIRRAEYLLEMRAALAEKIQQFNAGKPLEISIWACDKALTRKDNDEKSSVNQQDKDTDSKENETTRDQIGQSDMRLVRVARGISLHRLGSYLCSEKNKEELLSFARTFTFENIDLLEALRTFLSTFVLTGESQVIERVIETFSAEYLRQNEPEGDTGASQTLLAAYQRLSYGLVALNTMLHNPALEKRPSAEDFVSSCEAACSEVSVVGRDVLVSYYEEIKAHALQFPTHWSDSYDTFLVCASLCAESKKLRKRITTGHRYDNPELKEAKNQVCRETKSNRVNQRDSSVRSSESADLSVLDTKTPTSNKTVFEDSLEVTNDQNELDAIFDASRQRSGSESKKESLSETDNAETQNEPDGHNLEGKSDTDKFDGAISVLQSHPTERKPETSASSATDAMPHQANTRLLNTKEPSPGAASLCDACVIAAYHVLFKQTYRTYGFLNPSTFLAICKLLYHAPLYVEYMRASRCSPAKGLAAYSGFFATFDGSLFSARLADEFISLIADAARRSSTSLSDLRLASIRALFSASSSGQRRCPGLAESIEALRQRIRANTVPSLADAVSGIARMRFVSSVLSTANMRLLVEAAARNGTSAAFKYRSQPTHSATSQASPAGASSSHQISDGSNGEAEAYSAPSDPKPSHFSSSPAVNSDRKMNSISSLSLSSATCPGTELVIDVLAAIAVTNSEMLEDLRFITDKQMAHQIVICVPDLLAKLGASMQLEILSTRKELTLEELSLFDKIRRYDSASRDILVRSLAPEDAFVRAVTVTRRTSGSESLGATEYQSGIKSSQKEMIDCKERSGTRNDVGRDDEEYRTLSSVAQVFKDSLRDTLDVSGQETKRDKGNGFAQVYEAILSGRLREFLAGSIEFVELYSLDDQSHVIRVAGDIPVECPFKRCRLETEREISDQNPGDERSDGKRSDVLLKRMAWLWYRSTSAPVLSRALQVTERMPVLFLAFVAAYSFPVISKRQDELRALVAKRLQSHATMKSGKEICCGRSDCRAPEVTGLLTTLLGALNTSDEAVRVSSETSDRVADILEL